MENSNLFACVEQEVRDFCRNIANKQAKCKAKTKVFGFIPALGYEGDAFFLHFITKAARWFDYGTKWRKNGRTRNLLSLALSKKFDE